MGEKLSNIIKLFYIVEEIDKRVTHFMRRIERKIKTYSFIFLLNAIVSFLGMLYFTQGLIIWLQKNTSMQADVVYMVFGILLMLFAWMVTKLLLWREKTKPI